jgi:hypothetical protein
VGSVSDYVKVVIHRDFKPRTYKCKICGKEYYSRSSARHHVKKKHLQNKWWERE